MVLLEKGFFLSVPTGDPFFVHRISGDLSFLIEGLGCNESPLPFALTL